MLKSWRGVLGGLMLSASFAGADDAVKLGRFTPHPEGFGGLVKSAQAQEGADRPGGDDTEQAFWGRRRYWNGFAAGYSAAHWGGGWGCGWGGCYRPGIVTYYTPYVVHYPRVVTYSIFHYGYGMGWGGGWCGISGTTAPAVHLAQSQVPAARPVEATPVPPVAPATIPPATDDTSTITISLPGAAKAKPGYKFPAYGDKK